MVLLVTALVKLVRLPNAPAAKAWVPLTTEAAKLEPGRLGIEMVLPEPELAGALKAFPADEPPEVTGRKVGS